MSSGGETSDGGGGGAATKNNDALYEAEPKKIIRIITVTAYMVSVSFVGIVLSAYYIFLWHPPNPAEMHRQAMSAHHEARQADSPDELTTLIHGNVLPFQAHRLPEDNGDDVFEAQRREATAETLKIRREIVKNVNAILRTNYERTTRASFGDRPMDLLPLNDGVVASNEIQSTEAPVEDSPSPPMALPTLIARLRRTTLKSVNAKRQHQVPFPLKHLEVPIKSDSTRKRPGRPTASPADSRATSTDAATPFEGTSTESIPPLDGTSNRDLMKTLTSPRSDPEDYPSSTDQPAQPSISSEQFQAMPAGDYHDGTIEPAEDLMDE